MFILIHTHLIVKFIILKPLQLTELQPFHYRYSLRKLEHPHSTNLNHSSLPSISITLPFYHKCSLFIAKIHRQHVFRIIFTPTNKLALSKFKNLIELSNYGLSIILFASAFFPILDRSNGV